MFHRVQPLAVPLLTKNIPILKREGRLNYILKNWKKLINDPTIFRDSARERFHSISQQEQSKTPKMTIISKEETDLIYQEIRKILSKEAVSAAENMEGQILSLLFLVGKKNGEEFSSN